MDKRSFIFIIALTLTFFLTNSVFTYLNYQKNDEWQEQQKIKKEAQTAKLKEEIRTKTAPLSDFQMLDLGQNQYGVVVDDFLFSFLKNPAVPNWTFKAKDEKTGLAIFSNQKKDKLSFNPLPPMGLYDLQIVTLEGSPHVYWGEYNNGNVTIPAEQVGEKGNAQKGVAFFKLQPVGIYDFTTHSFFGLGDISSISSVLNTKIAENKNTETEEKFYVLQTPYQLLVFSNRGGSLAEINLPFQNETNPKSVVKEISYDRDIDKDFPKDDLFPNSSYYTHDGKVVTQGSLGGFYPLIRRALPTENIKINPAYYSMNLISEYPEVSEMFYTVKSFEENRIVFEAVQPHRKITKTYTIAEKEGPVPYTFDLEIKIEGDSRGLWLTSGVPEVELVSGASAPTVKVRTTRNQQSEVELLTLPQETLTISSLNPDWISNGNGFFGIITDPVTEIQSGYRTAKVSGNKVPSRMTLIGKEFEQFKGEDFPGYTTMLPLPQKEGVSKFRIYAGPFAESVLKQVDSIYSDKEGNNPDYLSSISYHGWFAFISRPFAKFLQILLNFFYSFTGSWAFSIILLTVALRIMLYPLNSWSMKSMAKIQLLAPEIEKIKKKYPKDPKKMQLEMATLYRERGINPLSGCFPILIQMPFLIGMFDLLKSSFELRGAEFIPGWIDNLAAPDVLFSWQQPIFFFGNEFHLLPFLLGFVMYLQQKLFTPQSAQALTDEQKQQRAMMSYLMPVLFTVMFYNVPSGLNIYWLSSMLLGIPQQWWTTRMMTPASKKV